MSSSVVRNKEVPADIQSIGLPDGARNANGLRVDKMLARIGLADSVSDATRKIKAGGVEINGVRVHDLLLPDTPAEMIVQVGEQWRRVTA